MHNGKNKIGCEFIDNDEINGVDQYLTWAYYIYDIVPDDISENEFQLKFMPSLKN